MDIYYFFLIIFIEPWRIYIICVYIYMNYIIDYITIITTIIYSIYIYTYWNIANLSPQMNKFIQ